MLIKQIQRAAVASWSPSGTYLAGGSAAQQLDATFNVSTTLELYELGLSDPNSELKTLFSIPSEHRFHKIVWGPYSADKKSDQIHGVIVGGCDDGHLQIYNASKLLSSDSNALIAHTDKHNGSVRSLDFNNFQSNLLASGASESEIYIWDLNNTSSPMTPGSKSQPFENVQWISWNRQVQHILASTFSTRCVVWDLRKNEPIIKLTDSNGRVHWRVVAWHPEVATQLCLASEDDTTPVVQLWDLRFATAPLKVLENHTRGILSIAWCQQDPDLLISCGKDNRILCWNPNSNEPGGEVLSEIARTAQWSFDVSWCPKNPALISACSSDGYISIYSLLGGTSQVSAAQQTAVNQHLADSFPGMDTLAQAPVQQHHRRESVSNDLAKPPKWLKRPVGASFGFGGKLIMFDYDKTVQLNVQPNQQQPNMNRSVYISQVVTDPEFVSRSNQLESAIQNGNFTDYCRAKADMTESQHQRYVWYFLKALFEPNPREELLNLLGYRTDDVNAKLNKYVGKPANAKQEINAITNQMAGLNRGVSSESEGDQALSTDTSADLSPGLDASAAFDAIASGALTNHLEETKTFEKPFDINTEDDMEGLITQALLSGNIEAAVELCFDADRNADALILAMSGGPDLLARTQHRYLQRSAVTGGRLAPLVSALVTEDWLPVVDNCRPHCWREALVAVLTHTPQQELPSLCQKLGERLESSDTTLRQDARLCYICAGSIEKLISGWWDIKLQSEKQNSEKNSKELQDLVEIVVLLQKAVEHQGRQVEVSGKLADLLIHYALLLTTQGNLNAALNYLETTENEKVNELRQRLHCSLGHKNIYKNQVQQIQQTNSHLSRQTGFYQPQSQMYTNQYPIQTNLGNYNNHLPPSNSYNTSVSPSSFNTNAMSGQQPWMQPVQQNKPFVPPLSSNVNQTSSSIQTLQPPPKTFSPAPPSTQPPRPSSVNSSHGASGLPKSKYVLDPSVQHTSTSLSYQTFGGSGSQFNTNPIMSSPLSNATMSVQPQNHLLHPNMPASNLNPPVPLIPQNISNIPAIPLIPINANQSSMSQTAFQAGPITQSSQSYSVNTPPAPGYSNVPLSRSMGTGGILSPIVGNEVPPPPLPNMHQPSVQSASGWNDPPVIAKGAKNQPKEYAQQNPITHPLYGAAPEQSTNNGYSDQRQFEGPQGHLYFQQQSVGPPPDQIFDGSPYQQTSNGLQQQQQSGHYGNSFSNDNYQQQSNIPTIQKAQIAEPPKPKGPIPEEHIHLKTVFDELQSKCLCAANNPQMKRKIEDVKRKLELLYDLLRESKLSPNTLSLLHQMVQALQNNDYITSLAIHTQLVSGSDFSQIASFMPGLKVLLQCAQQLQIYLI